MKLDRWTSPALVACAVVAAFWGMFSTPQARIVEAADDTLVLEHAKIYPSTMEPPIIYTTGYLETGAR